MRKAMKGDLDAIDTVRKLDQQTAAINGLIATKVKVGQDPEADPVGVNISARLEVTVYQSLKSLTPEQRKMVYDLRERMLGAGGGGGDPSTNGVGTASACGLTRKNSCTRFGVKQAWPQVESAPFIDW